MQKYRLCNVLRECLLGILILWVAMTADSSPASAKPLLSAPLLLPKSPAQPVRLKLPAAKTIIKVRGLRVLPSGAEIAPDNQSAFIIFCPDLTKFEIQPGQSFACPKTPVPKMLVEVTEDWEIHHPPGSKGPGTAPTELTKTGDELKNDLLGATGIGDELQTFLLASLYATEEAYAGAIAQYEARLSTSPDPAMLRLLGYLYLQRAEPDDLLHAQQFYRRALELSQNLQDLEGQALAHHQLALIHQKYGETEEALQQAAQAVTCYKALGWKDREAQTPQKLLEEPPQ